MPGLEQGVKTIDQIQMFPEVKAGNPQAVTILRHWYDDHQVFGGSYADNVIKARKFFATFVDDTFRGLAHLVDYVEEWNEYLANSQTEQEISERVIWAQAAAAVWKAEYRTQLDYAHIRLILCNTAIGNDIDWRFAEIASNYDCVLGYHPYTHWVNKKRDEGDWEWLSGRWVKMDHDFAMNHGLKADWAFTEFGPFEAAETGWRSRECLGGDRELYMDAVAAWVQDVQQTLAYKEGRIIATPNVFNSGAGSGSWESFETQEQELVDLGHLFVAMWHPGEEPPKKMIIKVVDGIGHLNLRSIPGVISPKTDIGDLHSGAAPIDVLEVRGKWARVAGWAHTDYLEAVEIDG
jgi:hypothetical protein